MTTKELNDLKKWGEVELAIKDTKMGITVHRPRSLRNLAEKLEKTNFDLEELLTLQHLLGVYAESLQRDIIDLLQLEKLLKELED